MNRSAERRHPLRFVWHMDADGRFGVGSDEFIELVGPHTIAAFGRLWSEIAAELKLDPNNQVARAVATRETWSGIVISWPVDDCGERLPIELSGLPVFDRDRNFRGYRGFGVCRDIDRINQLARRAPRTADGFPAGRPKPHQETEASARATTAGGAARPAAEAARDGAEPRPEAERRRTAVPAGRQCGAVPAVGAGRSEDSADVEPGGAPGVPRIGAGTHGALARPQRAGRREAASKPRAAERARAMAVAETADALGWRRRANAARPHTDRHPDLPPRRAALRQPAFSRMERL